MEKQLVTTVTMRPMVEGVVIPMVAALIDEEKRFRPYELIEESATVMLDELYKWAAALKPLRA